MVALVFVGSRFDFLECFILGFGGGVFVCGCVGSEFGSFKFQRDFGGQLFGSMIRGRVDYSGINGFAQSFTGNGLGGGVQQRLQEGLGVLIGFVFCNSRGDKVSYYGVLTFFLVQFGFYGGALFIGGEVCGYDPTLAFGCGSYDVFELFRGLGGLNGCAHIVGVGCVQFICYNVLLEDGGGGLVNFRDFVCDHGALFPSGVGVGG